MSKVLCLTKEKVQLCQKHFVWQMTKFNFFYFVFPNYCFLKVLRAFQVSRGHLQWLWENKVKLCFKALFKAKQRQSDIPNFIRLGCFFFTWHDVEQDLETIVDTEPELPSLHKRQFDWVTSEPLFLNKNVELLFVFKQIQKKAKIIIPNRMVVTTIKLENIIIFLFFFKLKLKLKLSLSLFF